jgi:citrate synthase
MGTIDDVKEGLEGVVVAATRLSDVDGERGRLVVGGHDVEALVGAVPFEAVVGLLLDGRLPDAARLVAIRAGLGAARVAASGRLPSVEGALARADAMDALRGALAQLEGDEPFTVLGAVAVYTAAWARRTHGEAPLPPDPSLGHADDLLRMATGTTDEARAAALDAYLVTVADHGMNASTFTARVVASTGSDLVSAVVAAIGALKGPLHGGAPGPVLSMLDAIGAEENAVPWLEGELAARRRIMGMGHRVYRVRDPRAAVLERATLALEAAGVVTGRLVLARAVERAAEGVLRRRHPDRPLHANVEFYTAVLLDAVGLPRDLFTATFAVARTAGWCAHVAEQRRSGRLIRPASRYVGQRPDDGAAHTSSH